MARILKVLDSTESETTARTIEPPWTPVAPNTVRMVDMMICVWEVYCCDNVVVLMRSKTRMVVLDCW